MIHDFHPPLERVRATFQPLSDVKVALRDAMRRHVVVQLASSVTLGWNIQRGVPLRSPGRDAHDVSHASGFPWVASRLPKNSDAQRHHTHRSATRDVSNLHGWESSVSVYRSNCHIMLPGLNNWPKWRYAAIS